MTSPTNPSNSVDLFILSGTFSSGGAEKVAAILGQKLSHNISRKLIALHKSVNNYEITEEIQTLSSTSCSSLIIRLGKLPVLFLRFRKLIRKECPKISLSILMEDDLINLFACKNTKTKPVVSFHWMPDRRFSLAGKIFQSILLKKIISQDVSVVAVSNGVKNALLSFGIPEQNITVLYNPVDIKQISVCADDAVEPGLFEDGIPVIITTGRLNAVKSQWHLIRAFAELRKTHAARLLICGIGPEKDYLATLSQNLDVADDVIFLGWQENPYKFMSQSEVFVLSSVSESFGNVLVEAMACGCPVITVNCSAGVREIIGEHNEFGLLSKSISGIRHNADESLDVGEQNMFELMKKLLDDREMHMKYVISGRERAKFFSVERRIIEYEQYFMQLLAETK